MSGEFYVEPVSDEKLGVTTVTIAGYVGSHVVTGTGASRLTAPDKFDADIGESLATVRALRQAADKLEKNTRREIDRREARRAKQAAKDEERRAIRQAHNELVRADLIAQGIIKVEQPAVKAEPGFWERSVAQYNGF